MFKKQRTTGHAGVSAAVAIALLTVSMPVLAAEPVPVSGASRLSVPTSGSVTINVGRHADYQDVRIDFLSVTADTRCPVGGSCASPGNAAIQLRVTQIGMASRTATLTLNTSSAPVSGTFGNWRIAVMRLVPVPTVQDPKPAGQYQVSLKLDKTLTTAPVGEAEGIVATKLGTDASQATPRAIVQVPTVGVTPLTVDLGQSAEFEGRRIQFVSVLSDSRCPIGVVCVTAGNAKVGLRVTGEGMAPADVEVNSSQSPTSVSVAGLTLGFASLTPLPTATKPSPSTYKLGLTAQTNIRR